MTPDELIAINAEHIHWNPNYNGGFHEYYLPITGDGRGPRDGRLAVRFGEHPDHPVRVWLIAGSGMIPLAGVRDTNDFLTMYRFVTGKMAPIFRQTRTNEVTE
jgi:hypothetical protein